MKLPLKIDKLTDVAEELKFESIWTLDRIVVPEKSDRGGWKNHSE